MTSSIGSFCKTRGCPTSVQLAAFQQGDIDQAIGRDIRRHLASCEFCGTEVELYGLFPPMEETISIDKMPEPLRELAEALLQKKRDLTPLYRLVDETD